MKVQAHSTGQTPKVLILGKNQLTLEWRLTASERFFQNAVCSMVKMEPFIIYIVLLNNNCNTKYETSVRYYCMFKEVHARTSVKATIFVANHINDIQFCHST